MSIAERPKPFAIDHQAPTDRTSPRGRLEVRLATEHAAYLPLVKFEVDHVGILPDMFGRGGHWNRRDHRLLEKPPECYSRITLAVPIPDSCQRLVVADIPIASLAASEVAC